MGKEEFKRKLFECMFREFVDIHEKIERVYETNKDYISECDESSNVEYNALAALLKNALHKNEPKTCVDKINMEQIYSKL